MTNLKKKIKKAWYYLRKKNKIKEENKNGLPTTQAPKQPVVLHIIIRADCDGGNFEIQNRSVNAECEMQKPSVHCVTHDRCDSGYSEGEEKLDKDMKYNDRCDSGYSEGEVKLDKDMNGNDRCHSAYSEGEEKQDSGYSDGYFENDGPAKSVRSFSLSSTSKEKQANYKLKQLTWKHNISGEPCRENITVNEDIQSEPEVSLSEEIEESEHQPSYQSNEEDEYVSVSSASDEQVTHVKLNLPTCVLDTDSSLAFSTFDKDITDVKTCLESSIGPGNEIYELVIQETECSLMEQKEPIADLPELQAAPYNDETYVKHVTNYLPEPDLSCSELYFSSGYPVFTYSNSSYSTESNSIEIESTMHDTDLMNQNRKKEQVIEPLQNTPSVNKPENVDLCVSRNAVQENFRKKMTEILRGLLYNAKTRKHEMCQSLENDNRMAMPVQNCSSAQMSVSLLMYRRNYGYTIRISVLARLESSCRLLFRTRINMISLICSYQIEMICYMSDEDKCWSIIDTFLKMCSLNRWFGDMKALSKQMTVIDMLRQSFRQHTDNRQIVYCDGKMLNSKKEIKRQTDSMGEDVVQKPDSTKDMKDKKITDCFNNVGNNVVKGYNVMIGEDEVAERKFQVEKNYESKRNEEEYEAGYETSDNLCEPFPLNLGTTSAEGGDNKTWTDETAVVDSSNPDAEDNTDTVGIKITKPSATQLALNVSSAITCQRRAHVMYYLGSATPEGSVSGHSKDQDLGSTVLDKTDGDDVRPEYTHESKRHEGSYERMDTISSEVFSDQIPSSSTTNVETSGCFIQVQNSDTTDMSLAGSHESRRDTCCTPMPGHTEQLLRQIRCSDTKSSQNLDSSMDRKSNSSSRRLKRNGKKRGSYFCKYCHKKRAEPNWKCKFPKMHIMAEANAETGHSASTSLDSGVVLTLLSSQLSSFYSSYKSTESQLKSDLVSKSNLSKKDNQRLALKEFFKIPTLRQLENELHRQVKTITRSLRHTRPADLEVFPGLAPYLEILNNGREPSDAERYRHEWARFQSFERYIGNGSGIVLARNGFYHNRENGPASTRCFECGASYSNWEYFDNVRSRHHPNCPLSNGNSTRNNPIRDGNEAGSASVLVIPAPVVSSSSTSSGSLSHDVAGRETTTSSETGTGSGANSIVTSSTTSSINTQQQDNYLYQPTTDRDNTEYTSNFVLSDDEDDHDEPQTTPEQNRRQQPPDPLQTRTASILMEMGYSQEIIRAAIQEYRRSTGRNDVEAEQALLWFIDDVERRAGIAEPRAETHGQIQIHPERILVATPKHPDYSTVQSRELTFNSPWPNHLDQTPRRMAEAGLFYLGVADFTRCYACGGGLRNWESGEDPVIEHTRWFPTCPYVHQLKGEQYVQTVTAMQQNHLEEIRNQQARMVERRAQQNRRQQPQDPLQTRTASILMEMGYSQEIIRAAIQEVRRYTGRNDVVAEQALFWIINDEERRAGIAVQRAALTQASAQASDLSLTEGSQQVQLPLPTPHSLSTPSSLVTTPSGQTTTPSSQVTIPTSQLSTPSDHSATSQLVPSGQPISTEQNRRQQLPDPLRTRTTPILMEMGYSQEIIRAAIQRARRYAAGSQRPSSSASSSAASAGSQLGATGGCDSGNESGFKGIESLKEENKKLREIQTCKICLDKPVDTTFLPCGHLVCCEKCASKMRKCPICQELIREFVKTLMS